MKNHTVKERRKEQASGRARRIGFAFVTLDHSPGCQSAQSGQNEGLRADLERRATRPEVWTSNQNLTDRASALAQRT